MKTKELELKDISGNLPYELFCEFTDRKTGVVKIEKVRKIRTERDCCTSSKEVINLYSIELVKPILRPLSDLYKPTMHNGKEIVPIVELAKIVKDYDWIFDEQRICASTRHHDFYYDEKAGFIMEYNFENVNVGCQYMLFNYMDKLKLDYRGMIDAGLAIDVNTLNKNPYK